MAIDWLDGLEARVREASARLGELKEENHALTLKVEELETRIAASEDGAAAHAWEAERDEIRSRVEKLTQTLEALVGR
ncbi:MAG TPA: cell division protein ZapB [Thermoanaerobaculia bacterium]|nr:cell division protein ZapB [Thermoanaerobaculia bacterium]